MTVLVNNVTRQVVISTGGAAGPRGTGWLFDSGAPANTLGKNGDRYVDEITRAIYAKAADVWTDTGEFLATDAAVQEAKAATAADRAAAETAKDAAELARDASFVTGPKYPDEATGRAAVADGVNFLVQGSGEVAAYEYRRDSAGASTLIATYPSKAAVENSAFDTYLATLDTLTGETDDPNEVPQFVTEDYLVVTSSALTVNQPSLDAETLSRQADALESYLAALDILTGETSDPSAAPLVVTEDYLVMVSTTIADSSALAFESYLAAIDTLTGEGPNGTIPPAFVTEDYLVIGETSSSSTATDLAFVSSGKLRAIGPLGNRILNEAADKTWISATSLPSYADAVYLNAAGIPHRVMVSYSTGNIYPGPDVIGGIVGYGQSNEEGQATSGALVVYLNNPYVSNALMPITSANNAWLGMITSGTSIDFDAVASITALGPLRDALGDSTHGTLAVVGAAYKIMAAAEEELGGTLPTVCVWTDSEGGTTYQNLGPSPPDPDKYAYANAIQIPARIDDLVPAGKRFVVSLIEGCQGEGNTSVTDLGYQHDQYRIAYQAERFATSGQVEPIPMIDWQPSSFQSGINGVKSMVEYYISTRAAGSLYLGGWPTYEFQFSSDWLHNASVGHDKRGQKTIAIYQEWLRTGFCDPLYAVSATITDTNEITATMSEAVAIDTSHVVIAAIANSGVTVPGKTVTGVAVDGGDATKLIITLSAAAAGATSVDLALVGHGSPRDEATIPRSNIRSVASLGAYTDDTPIYKWAAHSRCSIT